MPTSDRPPNVRVFADAAEATLSVLHEVLAAIARRPSPLLGFATGGTHRALLQRLAAEFEQGRLAEGSFVATHLDEYLGYPPERRGGMVHELVTVCPPLQDLLARGTLVPVPHDGDDASLRRHEERLQRLGGVELQLLGIGRNGHVAFNEPGVAFDLGFHVATLAEATRDDARARFLPDEPPRRAATAGIASILAARRLVLCAFGATKAAAVRAMLEGPIGPSCPASCVRLHGDALVVLDRAAAAECRSLGGPAGR